MYPILINIDVPDIQRGIAFYTEGLGLKLGRTFDAKFVELLGEKQRYYLLENAEGTRPLETGESTVRNYRRHWTPVHLDFLVDDLDAAAARVIAAGAKEESERESPAYGRIAYFADPFGHGFCLIEMNAEGYDAL